jgi:hypothetical protein
MKINNLPSQKLPFKRKTKEWRKKHLDWATDRCFENDSTVRKSTIHKKINYDLVNGKLYMKDLIKYINPNHIKSDDNKIPDIIQHYPIINAKLNVLQGEEKGRLFDYKAIVTNPNAVSEIEQNKKAMLLQKLQAIIESQELDENQQEQAMMELQKFAVYEWQDLREIRANALINHYRKEQNFPLMFNKGFLDAMICGEEIYQCVIEGGEPKLKKINPRKIRVYRNGFSNRIEDADIIIMEDYWSPGKIIDTYHEQLSDKDISYIENIASGNTGDRDGLIGDYDERDGFIKAYDLDDTVADTLLKTEYKDDFSMSPYDTEGNVRVVRMYWKSKRKIKKIKRYDLQTGQPTFELYDENYVIDESLGEEEEIYWISQAWEGTKIGAEIYINMKPCVVQYNRLSNPSECHFGIIGSIYNINDEKPFSMVDMMKSYSYMYDVIHDRLNKLLAKNMGKLIKLDLAKVPEGWSVDKWMYFIKSSGIMVENSFNEGQYGAATGVLAGGLNNNTTGVVDAELGQSIQMYIQFLEWIKNEMSEVVGINKQREGQVGNRETVGGVERANLQSSYITEWLFAIHDDVKKRVLECFLETAKIAMKGKSEKFQYILPDHSQQIIEIDGDDFADCDYGIVVDNSNDLQLLNQKLDMLAQAALQNQSISFSAAMKLYNSMSMAEKERMIEQSEQEMMQRQQQMQEQQNQAQQQQAQMQMQLEQMKMQHADALNQRDNETKLMIEQMRQQGNANMKTAEMVMAEAMDHSSETEEARLEENKRQFDEKMELEKEKFVFDKEKFKKELDAELLKIREQAKRKTQTSKS